MKQVFILFALMLFTLGAATAQVPQGFNYQAMIKDSNGHLITDDAVDIEINVSKDFSIVYCEFHEGIPVEHGLLNLIIGTGGLCGPEIALSEVDWSTGEFTMEVSVTDMDGVTVSGESPLVSVPFAMHAGTVASTSWKENGDYIFLDTTFVKVGLGTTDPNARLHVNGDARIEESLQVKGFLYKGTGGKLSIVSNTDGENSRSFIELWQDDDQREGELTLAGNYVSLRTGSTDDGYGSEQVRINSDGNVGIGTTDPAQKLDVAGQVRVQGLGGIARVMNGGSNEYIQFDANDEAINLATGGSTKVRIENSGNVGIGTTVPSQKLDVAGNVRVRGESGIAKVMNGDSNEFIQFDANDESVSIVANDNEVVHIKGNGRVGINTLNPAYNLDVNGFLGITQMSKHDIQNGMNNILVGGSNDKDLFLRFRMGGNPAGKSGVIFSRFNTRHYFMHNSNDVLTISHSTQDSNNPDVDLSTDVAQFSGFSHAFRVFGSACSSSGWVSCSDERFKTGFQPLTSTLEKVNQLEGIYYFFKKEEYPERHFSESRQIGVIAQEVEKVFPELVDTDEEGYKTVDYAKFTPILIEAIKDQQVIIAQQQAEIKHLKSANAGVLSRLEVLEAAVGNLPSATTSTDE